jgi:hypothetical protein
MTSNENSVICSTVTNDIGNKDDNHQDEDGRNELQHKLRIVNEFITAMIMQMCEYLQFLVLLRSIVSAFKRRMRRKRIRRPNLHRDRSSVLSFIHSWNDEMFKRQFRMTRPDFFYWKLQSWRTWRETDTITRSIIHVLLKVVGRPSRLS